MHNDLRRIGLGIDLFCLGMSWSGFILSSMSGHKMATLLFSFLIGWIVGKIIAA